MANGVPPGAPVCAHNFSPTHSASRSVWSAPAVCWRFSGLGSSDEFIGDVVIRKSGGKKCAAALQTLARKALTLLLSTTKAHAQGASIPEKSHPVGRSPQGYYTP